MKIVGRIVYAIVMVILFLFTFNYAQELMTSLYFENTGVPLLEEENVDYTFFYGSVPNFYATEAVFAEDIEGYEFRIFEIARTEPSTGVYGFKSYFYITIHSKVHAMDNTYNIVVKTENIDEQTGKNVEKMYQIVQFRQLNLFVAINELNQVYIDPSFFTDHSITEIIIKDLDVNVATIDASLNAFETKIDKKISDYYEINGLPVDDDLVSEGIYPYITHVMDDYIHVFAISMGVYFALLIISTYLAFFFKPRRNRRLTEDMKRVDAS